MVSKSQFTEAYSKHKPNLFIRLMFDLVSPKNTNAWIILFIISTVGLFVSYKLNFSFSEKGFLFGMFIWMLAVLLRIMANIMNNIRIKKICRELNINTSEYNYFQRLYL